MGVLPDCSNRLSKQTKMNSSLLFLFPVTIIFLACHVGRTEGASSISLSNEVDCASKACQDCLGDCNGCDNCPMCKLTQSACNKGKQPKFGDINICDKCSYCSKGTDHCKQTCRQAQKESICQDCNLRLIIHVCYLVYS